MGRADNISRAKLGNRDRKDLYIEVKKLASQGLVMTKISKVLNISNVSCKNFAKFFKDEDLLILFRKNASQAKSKAGKRNKGRIPVWLKGKTYLEIFKNKEKALARAKKTSMWMKTDKNIRKFCKHPSRPQIVLYNLIKEKYPSAQIEIPVILKDRTIWLDIVIPELNLDIEYDGEYWHKFNNKRRKLTDKRRDQILKKLDWKILRVSTVDISEVEKGINAYSGVL